jgi:hypothetical protein
MQYEVIAVAACCVLVLFVLIRISLTLNEISRSLRKLARRRNEPSAVVASTILHDGDDPKNTDSGEKEIAAAIAIARAAIDQSRTFE